MEAEYRYSFSLEAANDLEKTLRYMRDELDNAAAARSFIAKLEAVISNIRSFPFSGVLVDNPLVKRQDVRKAFVGNYILYYLPDAHKRTVYVLRLVYGHRDRNRIEKEL